MRHESQRDCSNEMRAMMEGFKHFVSRKYINHTRTNESFVRPVSASMRDTKVEKSSRHFKSIHDFTWESVSSVCRILDSIPISGCDCPF
jgi:hypothetical protein